MFDIVDEILGRWENSKDPFMVSSNGPLYVSEVLSSPFDHLNQIMPGDVVALIGDFDSQTISDLLRLISKGAIIAPLSPLTKNEHPYFFESIGVNWVVSNATIESKNGYALPALAKELRDTGNPGLILFSTGTTGKPKAILHDLTNFLERFKTPRPTLKTLAFLLFDHIGGLNTILHTIFNSGTVVVTLERSPEKVLEICERESVQVLPTTPTFLRLVLLSGLLDKFDLSKLEVITYGTERMEEDTLKTLCDALPHVDFRQTFGMSELGILRVKSVARDSLFMIVGGEGVKTKIVNDELQILSKTRMLGYLNAESPFDADGWYATGDLVEVDGEAIKIVGRKNDVINVGGLKFLPSQLEEVVVRYPRIQFVKVYGKSNPITGQHVEMQLQVPDDFDFDSFREFLEMTVPPHMQPRRIQKSDLRINHRFKKSG